MRKQLETILKALLAVSLATVLAGSAVARVEAACRICHERGVLSCAAADFKGLVRGHPRPALTRHVPAGAAGIFLNTDIRSEVP